MSAPRVSVILPTYNRAHLLPRAIESVLAQTHADFELIVVDDASTDETADVVAGINDARVSLYRLDANGGAAAARNVGLAHARGEFLAFIDSDDTWSPRKLEAQMAAMARSSDRAGLCVCSITVHRGRETFTNRWEDEEIHGEDALARIAGGIGYGTLSWLVRRRAIDDAGGFDGTLPRLQDYELTIRIARAWNVRTLSESMATANVQPDSLSSSARRYAEALEAILERHHDVFERFPRGHSHMLFRAGKYHAIEGRRREAERWFRRALAIDSGNVRALGGLLLCATGLMSVFTRIKYGR
jgi:glycosyltransferase involved in cell wall biosynthesis